jgi:aryl-alcohol dehydrogenase-like predicted oxidoreductase
MEYAYLGRTGLKVSRLCLGTMNFGPETEESAAFRIMDAALDAGINFFDTANVYGGPGHRGWTEEIIGRWFAQGGGRREKVVLATKVYNVMEDPLDGPNEGHGLSAYKIRRHLEGSLRRLQTDHIELYQMHHIERHAPWDEIWGAFETAIGQGKVGYIGASNFAGWHLAVAQAAAKERHFLGLVSEQHKYNLLCREPELEVLPAAEAHGIGVIPWSPLAGELEAFAALCAELGEHQDTVAIAWLLANPAVTAPIIGPRTLGQFEDSLRTVELKLSSDVLNRIHGIFPGPGKPAPEAYAW